MAQSQPPEALQELLDGVGPWFAEGGWDAKPAYGTSQTANGEWVGAVIGANNQLYVDTDAFVARLAPQGIEMTLVSDAAATTPRGDITLTDGGYVVRVPKSEYFTQEMRLFVGLGSLVVLEDN